MTNHPFRLPLTLAFFVLPRFHPLHLSQRVPYFRRRCQMSQVISATGSASDARIRSSSLILPQFDKSRYACICCCHSLLVSVFYSAIYQSASHCQLASVTLLSQYVSLFVHPAIITFLPYCFRSLWSSFHSGWNLEETRISHVYPHIGRSINHPY